MEDRFKHGGKMGGKGKAISYNAPKLSRSIRAGITFPVGRIARFMKDGRFAQRIGGGAPVYMAA